MTRHLFSRLLISVYILALVSMVACGGGDDSGQNGGGNGNGDGPGTQNTGTLRGSVTSSSGSPLNAVHVRAVSVSDRNLQISTFSGVTSNLRIQDGFFEITGLPPGDYVVLIEKLDSRTRAFSPSRYSDFVISDTPSISFPDEYFNGMNESSDDDPDDFVEVSVRAGRVTGGIDFITND